MIDPVVLWTRADLPAARVDAIAMASLTPPERARAGRFRYADDRARFVVGRALLRGALAERLRCEPAAVALRVGWRGKPHPPRPWRCSVAHSGNQVVVAIAHRSHVGVDVERIDTTRDHARLARVALTPGERHALAARGPQERARWFTTMWTAKEAYVKATGIGLALALRDIALATVDGEPVGLDAVRGDRGAATHWRVTTLAAPEGYVAALVTQSGTAAADRRACVGQRRRRRRATSPRDGGRSSPFSGSRPAWRARATHAVWAWRRRAGSPSGNTSMCSRSAGSRPPQKGHR
jgi:4'-phosphopantetheinyl transferase